MCWHGCWQWFLLLLLQKAPELAVCTHVPLVRNIRMGSTRHFSVPSGAALCHLSGLLVNGDECCVPQRKRT